MLTANRRRALPATDRRRRHRIGSPWYPRKVSNIADTGSTFGYVLEVDWNNNGKFEPDLEDVTAYTMAVSTYRGRNYASQLTGRSQAGVLRATLKNEDGRFSSFLASGPLYNHILPGRKVRLRTKFPQYVLWTGYLDRIEPSVGKGHFVSATLYASGAFIKLSGQNNRVSPPAMENTRTGEITHAILDTAGWDSSRVIDAGNVEVLRWFVDDKDALQVLQENENTEQGFLYEGLAWDIAFEERYRRTVHNLTSQATYSDDTSDTYHYEQIVQSDPLREIFNRFEATVQPYEESDAAILWTLTNETPVLAAGVSRTYVAKVVGVTGDQLSGINDTSLAYIEEWTTPVIGTDITQAGVSNSDLSVSVVKTALTMEITIRNNHATAAATLTLVQARGVPVLRLNPFKIVAEDVASQAKYGRRTFPLPSPWYFNAAYAEGTAEYVLARHAEPRPIFSLAFTATKDSTHRLEMIRRRISDRVTVKATGNATLGVNQDFYVEAIAHEIRPALHTTTFLLSPAEADPGWFVMDVSEMDVGVLAY